ncbi:MAG: fumarate hydratase [Planctomycetota bacterium]|jgi:fumarate hydratase class I|nr:fumarate hydratase [Planctomycetota bacterium]MDP6942260.1 fumarate hydratase [Planctomycetota bacterium]
MTDPTDLLAQKMFPLSADDTPWRQLSNLAVETADFQGQTCLKVAPESLTELARQAFHDIAHYLRPTHLQQLRNILDDSEASPNDRFVALDLLKNAVISAEGVLPMCQDTGTAIILGKKGEKVWTGGGDESSLSRGVLKTYSDDNLRYSQLAPLKMFQEENTKSNLPAQIDLLAVDGDSYDFLFMAKGGGSANKTFLYQGTPSLLREDLLLDYLKEKIKGLGTAACPPYHLAVVIGGTSAELNLKTVKLASAHYLDSLPTEGSSSAHAFRDLDFEAKVLQMTQDSQIGAQFGGKYFCHDVRVIRLPRHGASLPIGVGVSCSADRQIKGKINSDGVFLEQLETNPARFLPKEEATALANEVVQVDLNQPMSEVLSTLSQQPVRTRLSLSGPMVVARDLAHSKLRERLEQSGELPDYLKDHPVYYAGPAKTPEGYTSGSFGPTTAGRMDDFVNQFQKAGGSLVMVAKGNRSRQVAEACQANGGFYLGSVGGAAASLAKNCITKVECLEYEELGMEAVWKIEVKDFPAFIITDDKGNDFFLGDINSKVEV